jgi:uncharacterized protein YneF (UPF0154 family)
MSSKGITLTNTTLYILAIVVIILAFLLLGGGPWMNGMIHRSRTVGMANLNWLQIIISLGLGFILGVLVSKRR